MTERSEVMPSLHPTDDDPGGSDGWRLSAAATSARHDRLTSLVFLAAGVLVGLVAGVLTHSWWLVGLCVGLGALALASGRRMKRDLPRWVLLMILGGLLLGMLGLALVLVAVRTSPPAG